MTTTKTPSTGANEALGVTHNLTASAKPTKRTLKETDSDSPTKKRPKVSEQKDTIANDLVAPHADDNTRQAEHTSLWNDKHQAPYEHLKGRCASIIENTCIDDTANNTSKATSDSNRGISKDGGAPGNIEVQLDRIETTLEKLNKQQQAMERPSAVEDLSASTTDSHSSDPSGPRNQNSSSLPSPSAPPLPKVSSKIWHHMLIQNGWVANRPRSSARHYIPARRSRGGPKGSWSSLCYSTSSDRSATTEPEPEPLPSPSSDTKNSERSPVRLRAVPGTKAERLAEYIKYWQRSGKLDEEEKSHDNEAVKPKTRYNLRSTRN
ncbi:hypothetical protein B0H65DRAFT_437327 [Neurospora tetraspora]|uniref:Uncharacterized protein n=1 Tax=Neurospora tetraspora TaxID=94610 RepID=A0AAE0MJV3_9PEZI|nr:hypothetical protein B0H65DRAFT_437327 [Neurospora tetraspora]